MGKTPFCIRKNRIFVLYNDLEEMARGELGDGVNIGDGTEAVPYRSI